MYHTRRNPLASEKPPVFAIANQDRPWTDSETERFAQALLIDAMGPPRLQKLREIADFEGKVLDLMADGRERTSGDICRALRLKTWGVGFKLKQMVYSGGLVVTRRQIYGGNCTNVYRLAEA